MSAAEQLNILLVEDNEDDYIIVRDLLRDIDPERFTLEWADSYADGLRAIQGQRHDLILLDYRLPGGSGLTLLQETQTLSRRAPVIFMTGQGDRDIDVHAMRAGAVDYLVKDRLNIDPLERAIRYAVERQKAATALRASEERYRVFVANSSEGIWRFELERPLSIDLPEAEQIAHLDRYAYVAECNEAMAHIYGFECASDLIGAHFSEFLWSQEVSDNSYPRRLIRNQYRLVSVEAFEFDRSGQPKYIQHSLMGVVEDGILYRLWSSQSDVTERKQFERAQAHLAAIVETSDDAIFSQTLDGQIVTWNRGAEALCGYKASDVIGRHTSVLSPSQIPDETRLIRERIGRGERVPLFETALLHKDGRLVDVSLAVSPIIGATGEVTGSAFIARDISERKRAEASLTESRQRLALATESARIGIWDWDMAANHLLWDAQMYEIFGVSKHDFSGAYDAWQRTLHPDDKALAEAEIRATLNDGADFHTEFRIVWPNGEVRHIEAHATVQRADDGSVLRLIGVNWDITDRKKAQDALRQAEQEQRQLAARLEVERALLAEAQKIAKVGSWEIDLRADTLTWSDENHRIFGTDRGGFGGTYAAFLERVHPDERVAVDQAYTAAVANRTLYEMEHRIVGDDGGIKFVHDLCQTFYDDAGRPIRSVGTTQDVTANHLVMEALRKSEHEFRRIVETTHEGVLQLDADGMITYANRRFCDMLGYTAEELNGCTHFDLLDQESLDLARRRFAERRDGLVGQFDLHFRHKDGSAVWTMVSASPILDDAGRMIGSFGMITDITERKRLENQVRQSEKLAALGEMVAGVAHEINNPIAAILGNAELLEMHSDPQVRQDAQTIQRMSQRVTRIVRSLLTFARPQKEERREEVLNPLVENMLEMATHKLRAASIALTLRLQEPSPAAFANANEIQQILLNLVLNAEHALRRTEGEKRLVIATRIEQIDDRPWATVSVADNGQGIPDEIRARIFDPFFTTKDVGEGTGLGLSICHGIAEAHGGRLSVESTLGVGTTFTLMLPTADRVEVERPPPFPPGSPLSVPER